MTKEQKDGAAAHDGREGGREGAYVGRGRGEVEDNGDEEGGIWS